MSTDCSFILCLYYCLSSFLHSLLGKTLVELKTHASKNVLDRLVNRRSRLGNLEKYDRLINDFNTDFAACFLLLLYYLASFQF
jgi:hypothetical protein